MVHTPFWRTGLLAIIVLSMLATVPGPANASLTTASPAQGGACGQVDMSSGGGGQSLSCSLPCGAGSGLAAEVAGLDPDASSGVSINCGGAGSAMSCPGPACAVAAGPATHGDDSGECNGQTREFWDSGAHLACVATVGYNGDADPHETVCEHVPDFPTCDDVRDFCLAVNPEFTALRFDVQDDLFPTWAADAEVLAMTSAVPFNGDWLATVFYNAIEVETTGEPPVCEMKLYERQLLSDGDYELVEVSPTAGPALSD